MKRLNSFDYAKELNDYLLNLEVIKEYQKYERLIDQDNEIKKLETKMLPENIDYEDIKGISLEARQKLNKFKPRSIGQASRISGVSPADISVLLVYLQQLKDEGKNNE